jgi:small subunit ribosomal protein S13
MFIYKQVELNINKEIRSSLQAIHGIGWYKSILICSKIGLAYPFFFQYLNNYNKCLLSFVLDFFTLLEVRIKRIIYQNIKQFYAIGCYRGLRHKDNLPVRGQRTRSNSKSRKRYRVILND